MVDSVFVSHAMKDKDAAEALVRALERDEWLRCWIAPRDIPPSASWPATIASAIRDSQLMLVLLSRSAQTSDHVAKEVVLAGKHRVPIVPIRLDDAPLSGDLEYYLENLQHRDAPAPITDQWVSRFSRDIRRLLAPGSGPALEELTVDEERVAHPPPASRLPYDVRITRNSPACIMLLVDCSNSMHHRLGGSEESRRVVVARAINEVLHGLESFAVGEYGARPYFDIAVLGYGLGTGTEVESLLAGGDGLVSIVDISAHPKRIEIEQRRIRRPDGSAVLKEIPRKVWLDPTANQFGRTVARQAFLAAQRLAEEWIGRYPDAMPPIVLNITDGRYDRGEDPEDVVRAIQELATDAGNALVFNCHLADSRAYQTMAGATIFPAEEEAQTFVGTMRRLYDQSSTLPAPMLRRAAEANYPVQEGARGYAYNADAAVLVDFLEVGTPPISSAQ